MWNIVVVAITLIGLLDYMIRGSKSIIAWITKIKNLPLTSILISPINNASVVNLFWQYKSTKGGNSYNYLNANFQIINNSDKEFSVVSTYIEKPFTKSFNPLQKFENLTEGQIINEPILPGTATKVHAAFYVRPPIIKHNNGRKLKARLVLVGKDGKKIKHKFLFKNHTF